MLAEKRSRGCFCAIWRFSAMINNATQQIKILILVIHLYLLICEFNKRDASTRVFFYIRLIYTHEQGDTVHIKTYQFDATYMPERNFARVVVTRETTPHKVSRSECRAISRQFIMSGCDRKRPSTRLDESSGKKQRPSLPPLWRLVVCIIEANNANVNVHEVIFENANPTELLDLRKQKLKADGFIVASLYNQQHQLMSIHDGYWSAYTSDFGQSSPPNVDAILNLWMGQPKDTHEWAFYERDMRLIKEFDRFSPYHMAVLHKQHDWRMNEENYNYELEIFEWDVK